MPLEDSGLILQEVPFLLQNLYMKNISLPANDYPGSSNEYLYSHVDKEFRFVKANSLFLQKFELLSDDYIGKPFREVISLIEYKKILQAGKACLKDPGTVIKIDLNIKTASGDENWFQWEVSSLRSEDNSQEEGIQIIGIDITERKKSEQQLLYQAVSLNNISDAIVFTDINFMVKSFNKAAEKTYNIISSKIIGKPISTLFNKTAEEDAVFKNILSTVQQKSSWKGKTSYRLRAGEKEIYQQSSVNSVKDSNGVTIGYVIVSQKLTSNDFLSESNLSRVLLSMSEGFFVLDKHCRILEINKVGRKMIEWISKRPIEIGRSMLDFLPGEKQKILRVYVEKTFSGIKSEYESFYATPKRNVWLSLAYTPVRDEDKNIIGACIIARDITETKNAEKELDKSQQLFRMFMANTPAMGWIIDDQHKFRYINKKYKQSFQLTDSVIGKSVYEIFPKHICDSFIENNMRAWNKGTTIETIEEGVGPNGEKQVYQIYKFPLGEENGIKLLGGVGLDITENILTQENLLRSNERYDYAARATSDALWDWDIKRNVLFVGSGFKNIFGYAKAPGSIDERAEMIHPDDKEKTCKSLKKALNGTTVRWQAEYRFQCMDNSYKIILDRGYIIRNEKKEAIRVIGAMQDVTEQRTLVQKLSDEEKTKKREIIQAIIDAQEKERSELAYELHDNVNQILSSSKLMLDMVAEVKEDNLEFVNRSNEYLSEAICELRRISHNLSPGILKDISLEAAIQDIVDRINSSGKILISYRKRNYTKSKQIAAGDIQLTILRIAQEQLNNILKHAEATEVILQLFITKNRIALVIKDNGKGFDISKTKKGLGLHNIFNRVEYYQGTAQLDSAPSLGCMLKVEIPIEPSAD